MATRRGRTTAKARERMPLGDIDQLRARVTAAAGKPDSADARQLIADVAVAFGALAGEDATAARRWRGLGEQTARTAIESADLDTRLAAADRLIAGYALLIGAPAAQLPTRSGLIPIAAPGGGNPALAQLLRQWADGGRLRLPEIDIELGGGTGLRQPCVPGVLRSQVVKPGLLPELDDAGLEPDFLDYLRGSDRAALRSYASWRAAQAAGAATDADSYQAALAAAYRGYEDERFADRYCRPGDIAAPGEQYGHRLLRLPLRLRDRDFRAAGCGAQIYEGELGAPLPPELDYEELVRRYVELLKPQSRWRVEVNALTRGDIVASHLRYLGSADAPAVLHLMVTASQTALQVRTMASLIEVADDLQRRGQNLIHWLLGPEATELREAVLASWQRLVGAPAAATAALPATLAGGTLSRAEFARALTGLCLPAPPPPGFPAVPVAEPRIVGLAPAAFYPGPPAAARTPEQVRAEIERLVTQYDTVWSQAAQLLGPAGLREARQEIRLSGLEARAHIAHLAVAGAVRMPIWALGGTANARAAVLRAVLNWLAGAAVPLTYDDVVGALPDQQPNPQAVVVDQWSFMPKEYWQTVQPPGGGAAYRALTDPAYAALAQVIDSYGAALDAVISAAGANAGGAASAGAAAPDPYAIRAADLPALLQRWTGFFFVLIAEQRARRQAVDEPLLLLRLVPRRGRYGETPQRTAGEELAPEPKLAAWPGHPTRATEGYVLEPFPRRYFMRHEPALYLREDYRVALLPRAYGIGANLYSMSLLPQEEQTIVVKSFKDTRSKVSESTAENVFEEAGSETSNDFANELARESQQESSNQSEFSVAAKASASFLFGAAEMSSGYGAKDSTRDFAKNVSNVTSKLAQKLSAKRTVTVETKRAGEQEQGTRSEISTERKVKNPNMGHTVTFHWFQMTRKFVQQLWLEDAKLVYSAGKHNVLRVLAAGELPPEIRAAAAQSLPAGGQVSELVGALPTDIAQRLPPGAAVVIVGEPYTEVVTLAAANGFLARVFDTPRAVQANAALWRHLGYFDAAPDGLGVLAYPGNRRAEAGADRFVPLDNLPDPRQLGDAADPTHVVADRVAVRLDGQLAEEPFYLPNLDLRYRVRDGQPPARYSAARYDPYALPRLLAAEERVVNTNGVFCEAMVGRCTALEPYLQRYRELDLLERRITVGRQEIEFRWNLAKDHLVEIREDADRAIVALVDADGAAAFAERIEVEQAQQAQQRSIAEAGLERQKMELELAYRQQQIAELEQRIALMAEPSALRIDAPDGASVAVNANVEMGRRRPEAAGGGSGASVAVE
jgi:hypothetical protein